MLTNDEFRLLQEQLAMAFSTGVPKNIIVAYFDINAPVILRDIPTNLASNDQYSYYVIDFCMRSRWSFAPSLMEKLLDKLLAGGVSRGTADLLAALQRVRLKQDPNDKFYYTYWVLNEQPFLNRQTLRPLLKGFIQSNNQSLLQISGPGAGRRYTKELFDYLTSQVEGLHFVPVLLNEGEGPSYRIRSLAADLLSPMGEDVPDSSSSSDAGELCRRILRTTKMQMGLWIFMLAGFDQPELQPQVKELIQLLAEKCTEPEYRRKMRVVLIGYSEPLKRLLPAAIAKEDIPLPTVNREDVIDCLTQLNQERVKKEPSAIGWAGHDRRWNISPGTRRAGEGALALPI